MIIKYKDLFEAEKLLNVLKVLSETLKVEDEKNYEITASQFLKKTTWLETAVKEYLNGYTFEIDRDKSTYLVEERKIKLVMKNREKIEDEDLLMKKFHQDFFLKEIFPLLILLDDNTDFGILEIWDMIHYNIFRYLGNNENDKLFLYFKERYTVFDKEIKKVLGPDGEEFIYARNTCCGKYKTNVSDNCKVCPFING